MNKSTKRGSANSYLTHTKKNKGITLIALVITIIVMIILVGVTISIAVNGGLFDYAGKATGETQNAIDEEQALAEGKIKIEETWYNSIDEYVNKVDFEEIFKTAKKHPKQTKTNDIGIAEDGSIVNLDLWTYFLMEGRDYMPYDGYSLGELAGSAGGVPGYDYKNITEDGTIQGKVPMYIKGEDENEFFPVTSMWFTFIDCEELTVAPKIPSSVKFMDCAFYGCTSLTTAPEIPSGVESMVSTFSDCNSLTGSLVINANPDSLDDINFDDCLAFAAINEGCALELIGPNQDLLYAILDTAYSDSNITVKE